MEDELRRVVQERVDLRADAGLRDRGVALLLEVDADGAELPELREVLRLQDLQLVQGGAARRRALLHLPRVHDVHDLAALAHDELDALDQLVDAVHRPDHAVAEELLQRRLPLGDPAHERLDRLGYAVEREDLVDRQGSDNLVDVCSVQPSLLLVKLHDAPDRFPAVLQRPRHLREGLDTPRPRAGLALLEALPGLVDLPDELRAGEEPPLALDEFGKVPLAEVGGRPQERIDVALHEDLGVAEGVVSLVPGPAPEDGVQEQLAPLPVVLRLVRAVLEDAVVNAEIVVGEVVRKTLLPDL
mmetsp:Transcript_47376/g.133686  ORF Transcript_47376/g.133686 Transcript_47376/m.133686 type:complete len:300 (-) Transcript_47376:2201-3100(-)